MADDMKNEIFKAVPDGGHLPWPGSPKLATNWIINFLQASINQ